MKHKTNFRGRTVPGKDHRGPASLPCDPLVFFVSVSLCVCLSLGMGATCHSSFMQLFQAQHVERPKGGHLRLASLLKVRETVHSLITLQNWVSCLKWSLVKRMGVANHQSGSGT